MANVLRIFEQRVNVAHKPKKPHKLEILNYGNNHLRDFSREYFQNMRKFNNFHFAQKFNVIILLTQHDSELEATVVKIKV